MDSLGRVRKELNILLSSAVVVVVITEFFLRDIPEIFPKAAVVGDLIVRLALSYIASYIFYVVVVHLKAEKDKRALSLWSSTRDALGEPHYNHRPLEFDLEKRSAICPKCGMETRLRYSKLKKLSLPQG